MNITLNSDLTINGSTYKPIEIKGSKSYGHYTKNNMTHYLYDINGVHMVISQEYTDNVISFVLTRNKITITNFLEETHLAPPKYQICFSINMSEIEKCFNELIGGCPCIEINKSK